MKIDINVKKAVTCMTEEGCDMQAENLVFVN